MDVLEARIAESEIGQLLGEINQGENDPTKRLVLDAARIEALKNYEDIQACPGSGKTTLVGLKLLLLARKWRERHSGVCVLTHSNVARDEVLKVLRKHPAGGKLLSYPHFVGTIQDFINTFFGMPYARSRGWSIRLYGREEYAETLYSSRELSKKVQDKKKPYKRYEIKYYVQQKKVSLGDLRLVHDSEKLILYPAFLSSLEKHCEVPNPVELRNGLKVLRKRWCEMGVFQFSEMYALAEQLMHDTSLAVKAVRHRFPIVLIDEMQDTQRFQDDLINRAFKSDQCFLQRFGDPDQSIFDGIGREEPNASYNNAVLRPIAESHRFTPDIASKLSRLSYSRLSGISTSRARPESAPPCTILLFDDDSIGRVIDRFAELVFELPSNFRKTVRAVGAVAESESSPLTIKSYWPDFQKVRPVGVHRPATLFEAVRLCAESGSGHVFNSYQILIDSVLELLQRKGMMTVNRAGSPVHFTASNLRPFLRKNLQEEAFRELLAEWIMGPCPTEEQWSRGVERLTRCLNLGGPASEYLAFAGGLGGLPHSPTWKKNIRHCSNGVDVEISTIHATKGETHDATLVLETKYHLFDLQEMTPYLCDPEHQRPRYDPHHPEKRESLRASFMKKIYVAASRPRYLLCLAMHRSHLSQNHLSILSGEGWDIIQL